MPAPPTPSTSADLQDDVAMADESMEPQPSTSAAAQRAASPQPSTSAMAYAMMPPPAAQAAPSPAAAAAPAQASAPATDEQADDNEDLNPMSQFEDEEGGFTVGDIYIPPPVKPYCSSESHGSRLMITKIMNTNFKSYAQNVALGPFCHVSAVCLFFSLSFNCKWRSQDEM